MINLNTFPCGFIGCLLTEIVLVFGFAVRSAIKTNNGKTAIRKQYDNRND